MNKLYPVYTLQNDCHDCYKCVRECHIKAIKIEDGHASVIDKKCIACGHCVKACPSNAKRIRYDIEKVKTLFKAQKKVFVSLAPSWSGVFDFSSEKMIALLKKLGFEAVSETALGAQEVSIETVKMINKSDNGLFISSACPVIVDYIRLYNPKFAKNITPVASPALTHAKMLKEIYGQNISVVFIGPCIGKKNEADKHPELIDVSLTFEELNYWVKEEFINISELHVEKENFVPEFAYEGSLYPIEGGMNETIKQVGIPKEVQLINISSLETFEKALEGLNTSTLNKKIFVEALACDGGCVNGPAISSVKSGITVVSDILDKVKKRKKIPQEPSYVVKAEYKIKPVKEKEYSLNDILESMKRIGKHSEEDELNCGGCGYRTCSDLAKALISGEAETSMCVSYMRKLAMRKAAAMLRCMPSAIVMVDGDFRILEANNAFMKMFCKDSYDFFASRQDGLTGVAIDRIIDFSELFKTALNSGKDIHKEHYSVKDRLYDITVFTIEPNTIVGAIITDVTQPEMNREKIAHKAQEVISKNIAIVQDIACLLGEHMVETELLLSSIAEGFETKD